MEEFYSAMTGGREYTSGRQSWASLAADLVAITGTKKAAAAALGISVTTFYRARTGKQKPGITTGALAGVVRRAQMPAGLYDDIKSKRKTLRITGTIVVSSDERPDRTINVGIHIPSRKMMNVVKAWMAGDDDRAERLLWKHIDHHYVDGLDITQVDKMEFRSPEE